MRILWLKTELLHPVDKGGKIRTYQMLRQLKRSHHVTYLTLDDGSAPSSARELASEYCHELIRIPHTIHPKFSAAFYSELTANLLSRWPYAIKKYESKKMRDELTRLVAQDRFDVVICDFLAPAGNIPSGLSCSTVLFQHNVEALIWKRHAEIQTNPLKRRYLRDQWRKMEKFEARISRLFDAIVTVSDKDKALMISDYGSRNVYAIPTGVDVDYFRPTGAVAREPNNLVFTGSMDWLPNEDGIRYFTAEVMPLIRREIPSITLTVVGRDPYPALLEISRHDNSIVVTGRVEDVRPYIEKASAYIVPLRIGGGTRLKIYEAMAMERAVISTTVGAEGLPITDGRDLLLADTAEEFAQAVSQVLRNPNFADQLGKQAADAVRRNFGWDRVAEAFANICEVTLQSREGRASA